MLTRKQAKRATIAPNRSHGGAFHKVDAFTMPGLLAGGSDKSLRRWERTDEPFFVEEEREKRLESLFEAEQEVRYCLQSGSMTWCHVKACIHGHHEP